MRLLTITAIAAPRFPVVSLLLLPLTVLLPLVSSLSQRILVRVDDLVYELAIRRLVPPDPVSRVAAEAAAVERRGMGGFRSAFPAGVAGESGGGGGGAGDEIGENLPVVRRERGREGEYGSGEESEVVGDERWRRVNRPFMVELLHEEGENGDCVGYSFFFFFLSNAEQKERENGRGFGL